MSTIKQWYSTAELAAMKLKGYSASRQGWESRVKREAWPYIEEKSPGRGGIKRLYKPTKEVMALIAEFELQRAIVDTKSELMVSAEPLAPANLKDWQRRTAEARAAICSEVKRLAEIVGKDKAIMRLVDMASQGTLPEHIQQLVPVANARSGKDGKRTLSRRSIYRWLSDIDKGIAHLAPKSIEHIKVPSWAAVLLKIWGRPQQQNLTDVVEELHNLLPPAECPSYDQAYRFLKKMSRVDVHAGRLGQRALRNIKPFVRRDTSQMWPGDAYTADGHTFDAEVAHPRHGKPFRPELTTVIDIGTRRAVGWSAGLAESTWAVLDALRHACLTGGIPAIFYVDNGSGYRNAVMSDIAVGFMARLNITLTHSLPYNSQARGIIERAHQTIWVKAAKKLPTYIGADMDREARQKAYKITRADLRLVGSSRHLMPWNDFLLWCQEQIDAYNNRPHRALPKIRDQVTGKMRHQSPNEAWQEAINEGWKPTPVEPHEADDLFRPYKEAKTHRGEVRLFNNLYFHPDLEHYHGEMVRVGYDIHDASRVWVRDQQGRLICVAEFEANKRSYFPQSFINQAAEKRAKGRIKRAEAKIEEAMEELQPSALIEHQPSIELPAMDIEQSIDTPVKIFELQRRAARPMFETDASKYRWLMSNADQMTPEDGGWLDWYRTTSEWEDLFGDREVATR